MFNSYNAALALTILRIPSFENPQSSESPDVLCAFSFIYQKVIGWGPG